MGTYRVMPVTTSDYRRLSEKRLPRFLFDYIDGGAGDEFSLAANVEDFRKFRLRQRVLVDVDHVDTSAHIGGRAASMPVALAPIGLAGMFGRRGEVLGARAAARAGIPFTLSTVGVCTIGEVQAGAGETAWFQLYMLRDRGIVQALLEHARSDGCDTLIFTVDLPVAGARHRDFRNGMVGGGLRAGLARAWQLMTRPRWVFDVGLRGKPHSFGNLNVVLGKSGGLDDLLEFVNSQFDPTVTWDDIAWLRKQWGGRLLIKGIMSEEDARAAVDAGADGVVVSNHGGRQLEGVASSISRLPSVAAAVGEQVEVLVDGGIRSGTDVVKALALGANGVLIGRPWVWAMSARGEDGLADLLAVFQREISITMALMGVTKIADITPQLLES